MLYCFQCTYVCACVQHITYICYTSYTVPSVTYIAVVPILFLTPMLYRIVFRLYWFITKALYSSAHVSRMTCINIAFYLPFNAMLFALYLMQVYWFYLIVKLLIKVCIYIRTLGIDDITQIKLNCIITLHMVWKLSIYIDKYYSYGETLHSRHRSDTAV